MTPIGETVVIDLEDNQCFGCSQERSDGLAMSFTRTGERQSSVSTRFQRCMEAWAVWSTEESKPSSSMRRSVSPLICSGHPVPRQSLPSSI